MPSGFPDKNIQDTIKRFHQSYTIVDDCWLWNTPSKNGYGVFGMNKRKMGSHRASLILHNILIPNGYDVCHRCPKKSRLCVNPAHLRIGTRTENNHDKISDGTNQNGETHHNHKLTTNKVIEIRRRYLEGCAILSQEFSISQSSICDIIKRRTWKHI